MSDPTSSQTTASGSSILADDVRPSDPLGVSENSAEETAPSDSAAAAEQIINGNPSEASTPVVVVSGANSVEMEEELARHAVLQEGHETLLVAALCETVGFEEVSRNGLIAAERCTWDSLSEDARNSLAEALTIWRLENELRSLQDEDEKLRVIIESQEVLLEYSVHANAYLAQHSEMLTSTSEKLGAAKGMLAATTGRLEELPISEHELLSAALAHAEGVVLGKEEESSTRPQLVDAWQSLQVAARQSTEAGDEEGLSRDPSSVSYVNTTARCDAVLQRHQILCQTIDALFHNHEAALLEAVERKESEIKELGRSFDAEISSLETARKHLKQVEDEQLFHIRRGTFIKERQDHISHDALLAERVKQKHTHLCEAKLKVEKEIEIVSNDVRDAKRSLEDLKRVMEESRHQTATRKHDFTDEQLSASRTRALLEQENEDLRLLKSDLTKVLQFVKLKNKEE